MLERIFHLRENDTTVRRELLAGVTTFTTMAYVVVVNPRILAETGMPVEGVLFATCISAAVATLIMGLWANYPIALAPGMSLNAYFTYTIVLGPGRPVADRAGSGLSFRPAVFVAHVDQPSRTHRQWHPRLPETRHRGGHRLVHRLRRIAQRQAGRGQSCYLRRTRENGRPTSLARGGRDRLNRRS